MWMARETGANLVGIDLSPVAVEEASKRAMELGLAERAQFRQGTFADTGLAENSVDGAMSEDAIQYAPDKRAFAAEAARILRPGGRFVFTVFEVDPVRAAVLPGFNADPVPDYRPVLTEAGVDDVAAEALPAPRARRRNEKLSRLDSGLTGGRQTCRWRGSAPA